MTQEKIINNIEYHKNKKIDVLKTYWNLKNNGFNNFLNDFFKKIGCVNCPFHILNNTNEFRNYLKNLNTL